MLLPRALLVVPGWNICLVCIVPEAVEDDMEGATSARASCFTQTWLRLSAGEGINAKRSHELV